MYEIKTFADVYANQVNIYSIQTLLNNKLYPRFSLYTGTMGVGKSSVAQLVADILNQDETKVGVYNMALGISMNSLEKEVFSMNPALPRAFIFEELHALTKEQQTALLAMLDKQPKNIYIIATTTEEYQIIKTVKSRAQIWSFRGLTNKQMSELADRYTGRQGKVLDSSIKKVLIQASRGIPRDLIKNIDLALNGSFNADTLNEILGNMSDDVAFTVFCALKADSVSFAMMLTELVDRPDSGKVDKLRDFWLRFVIESQVKDADNTLSPAMISTLQETLTDQEQKQITKLLINMTPATLYLNLILANTSLRGIAGSNQQAVGQQKDMRARAEQEVKKALLSEQTVTVGARLSASDLASLHLG